MHRVHIPSLSWHERKSPTGKFHSFARDVSLALGGLMNTGTWGGGHPFDVQIRRIPAGAAVAPYHAHLGQWELFLIQHGTGTVRTTDGSFAIGTGDVFYHPPGTPHQLLNSGSEELEVLIVADNPPLDSCHYPDSNKRSLRPPGLFFRIQEADYFAGEDELSKADAAPPQKVSPTPSTPAPPSFIQRRVRINDLPWESWKSPGGKFNGESKELSIALGAKRNTPTRLGGHPFDLELSKLRPGESGCPFHSHAAEWEMFMIVSGTATVRADQATHVLVAGDVCIHPPGEAHQITNASPTDDLVFYLVADNAPVEYWYYPDSNKWGFRNPRKFFRTDDVDYWEGEE